MSLDSLKGCTKGNNFETSDYVYNIGQAGIVQLRAAGDPVQAGSYFFVLKSVLSLPACCRFVVLCKSTGNAEPFPSLELRSTELHPEVGTLIL